VIITSFFFKVIPSEILFLMPHFVQSLMLDYMF
jgi:hypothetical protein